MTAPLARLMAGLVAAFMALTATAGVADDRPRYTLGSGDRLKVVVFGHDDLTGEYEVGGAGTVSLPLVGDVDVGGRTVDRAEAAIEAAFKPDYLVNPRVSVQVLNYRPFYILGEVKEPGSYDYVNGLTVVEAVSIAGGYSYRADRDDVVIRRRRDGSTVELEDVDEDTAVLPGDTIRVPQRFF